MKLNMKHSVLPRLLALVFALTLLLTAAVTPASAAERDYTRWEYDPASDTLTATFSDGDTEVYVRYGEPSRLRFLPLDDFIYKNTVKIGDVTYRVHAPRLGAETVVLTDPNDGYRIYVTRSQEKSLDTLLGLENLAPALTYFEYGKLKYADMSKGFMRDLRKLKTDGETLRGSLHEFRYAPRYELWGYDDDEYLSANLGMLFDLAGEMYYLDVLELPDSAFDESGALLPSESLTVTLYRLPEELADDAYRAVSQAYTAWFDTETESISSDTGYPSSDDASTAFIYFTVAFLGIAVPIAPLVLGLCLPHSAKQGYKKRWYLLAIFGGAWMLLGILVLVMMIVAL